MNAITREEFEDAIRRLKETMPKPTIKAAVISVYAPGEAVCQVEYEGDTYFLMTEATWNRIEPQLPRISSFGIGMLYGFPILHDDEIAKNIMLSIIGRIKDAPRR